MLFFGHCRPPNIIFYKHMASMLEVTSLSLSIKTEDRYLLSPSARVVGIAGVTGATGTMGKAGVTGIAGVIARDGLNVEGVLDCVGMVVSGRGVSFF